MDIDNTNRITSTDFIEKDEPVLWQVPLALPFLVHKSMAYRIRSRETKLVCYYTEYHMK